MIGCGNVAMANDFADEFHVTFPLYVDPGTRVYAAAGLKRGAATVYRPGVILRGLRNLAAGYRQAANQGDPFQQGGVFIVGTDGEPVWVHISEQAGDHPSPDDVVAALPAAH